MEPQTTNPFKQALRDGHTQIGLWSSLCSNIAAEVCAGRVLIGC